MSLWDINIYEINPYNADTCRTDPLGIRFTFNKVVPADTLLRTGARSSVDTTLPQYKHLSNIPLYYALYFIR